MATRLLCILVLGAGQALAAAPFRVDRAGDPLPEEALARMGSLRFRQGATIHSLAFTPDGAALVTHGWGDNGVCVWNAATGKEIRRFAQGGERVYVSSALSPDGKLLAAASGAHAEGITLWEVASGKRLREIGKRRYRSARFAPDGKTFAAFALDGYIELWDPASGDLVRSWDAHPGGAWYGSFGPDGKTLTSAGADGAVRAWEVATAIQTSQIDVKAHADVALALSPNGKLLAVVPQADSGGSRPRPDGLVRVWDLAGPKRELAMAASVGSLAFSPDGKLLATGVANHTVLLWDMELKQAGKALRHLGGYFAATLPVAFSPDGKTLAVADGGTLRLYDSATGKAKAPVFGPPTWVFAAALSSDGKTLATAGQGGVIHLWEAATGRELRELAGHENNVLGLALSMDGRILYSVGQDKQLRTWDLVEGKEIRKREGIDAARLSSLALSPDGATLAVPGPDKTVLLLEATSGKERRVIGGFDQPVNGVSFSPAGALITWTRDQAVVVWNPQTGEKRRQFATGEARQRLLPGGSTGYSGYAAAVSPNGRLVALGLQDRVVFVLDTATGQEVRRLTGLLDGISALAFSADSQTLAWGGFEDGTVHLVELATGREAHSLRGHRGRVTCLTFSADGRSLVSGGGDTTALVWDTTGRLALGELWGKPLAPEEADALWERLRGEDAGRACQAIRRLAAAPEQSIPHLEKRLKPIAAISQDRLARLIAELDSENFAVRQQAAAELDKLGEAAEGAARKAMEARPSPEARRRLEELLEHAAQRTWSPSPERLRTARAVQVLELAATPEAVRLLKTLAAGAEGAWLTEGSKAALSRLHKRHPSGR
jgi:WD40 repeat protein